MFAIHKIYGPPLISKLRLTQIDDTLRAYHYQIEEHDECYFLHEYTANKGYSFSKTNSLISNLKKKPSERNRAGYHHKMRCIREASRMFSETLNPVWLDVATLVPIPGSKAVEDPDYDDRMELVCRGIRANLDVRPLVKQRHSTRASHQAGAGNRVLLEELLEVLYVDEELAKPEPTYIGIFDDVLTNGTHFKAVKSVLTQRFPAARISGFFIARTVHPDPFQDFDWDT